MSSQEACTNKRASKTGKTSSSSSEQQPLSYMPVGIDVRGLRCLIVGGGKVALRKTETLIDGGAKVTVVAPDARDELQEYAQRGTITWIQSRYSPDMIQGNDLVVASTSDKGLNIEIGSEAERLGIFHCVVSSAPNSQLIFPAVYKQGKMTVAVHSNGTNCRYSKAIRNRIESFMNNPHPDHHTTVMLGFQGEALDDKTLEYLREFGQKLRADNPAPNELLVLSTCCRWECYINGPCVRDISRRILQGIKKELPSDRAEKIFRQIRHRAQHDMFFHLLKTCLGLNSYLYGETEIVHQVRTALDEWIDSDNAGLYETITSALLAAKKIRQSTSLAAGQGTWAENTVDLVRKTVLADNNGCVLTVGKGHLSDDIIPLLLSDGYSVVNFSRHFSGEQRTDCGPYQVVPTDDLGNYLHDASAIIIASELTQPAMDALVGSDLSGRTIIDLAGSGELLVKNCPNAKFFPVSNVPRHSISPADADSIASANLRAFEQAMVWHSIQTPVAPPKDVLRLGARSSELSRKQVIEIEHVLHSLSDSIQLEKTYYEAPCDRDRTTPLTTVMDDDFFTRDLDLALLAGDIDLAVHSAKDLPETVPSQLIVAAVTPSIATWDCLVSRGDVPLMSLPKDARVATSSHRRRENIAHLRPDIHTVDVRGDVPNRIQQLETGNFDALIAASVAMIRLGRSEHITEIFPEKLFPTTPGQGSLALMVRRSDTALLNFLRPLNLGAAGICDV